MRQPMLKHVIKSQHDVHVTGYCHSYPMLIFFPGPSSKGPSGFYSSCFGFGFVFLFHFL